MTVRELMELLSEFRPDARVMVDGYEGGVKGLERVRMVDVFVDYHSGMTYYGPHEVVSSEWVDEEDTKTYAKESVVYLPR